MEKPAWAEQLPGDLQGNESLTQFQTVGDLGSAFIEREGKLADSKKSNDDLSVKLGNSIPKLGDNPTAEAVNAYHKAVGRPDDINGYDLQKPELPEGLPYSDETVGAYKSAAHAAGLTSVQAKGLFDWYMNGTVTAHKAEMEKRATARTEAETALKTEYGSEYDANLVLMKRAVDKFGDEGFKQYMDDSGFGNDPRMIKLFVNIAKAMSEDTLILGNPGASEPQRGPDGRVVFDYPASPEMKR